MIRKAEVAVEALERLLGHVQGEVGLADLLGRRPDRDDGLAHLAALGHHARGENGDEVRFGVRVSTSASTIRRRIGSELIGAMNA